jgi:hypothetical protein
MTRHHRGKPHTVLIRIKIGVFRGLRDTEFV